MVSSKKLYIIGGVLLSYFALDLVLVFVGIPQLPYKMMEPWNTNVITLSTQLEWTMYRITHISVPTVTALFGAILLIIGKVKND